MSKVIAVMSMSLDGYVAALEITIKSFGIPTRADPTRPGHPPLAASSRRPTRPLSLKPFPLGALRTPPVQRLTQSRSLTIVATDRRFIELWRPRRHSYLTRLQLN
jgi:hypothetical protein